MRSSRPQPQSLILLTAGWSDRVSDFFRLIFKRFFIEVNPQSYTIVFDGGFPPLKIGHTLGHEQLLTKTREVLISAICMAVCV